MLATAGPLGDVPLEDLERPFITVVQVQPRLATAHAKLFAQVLGLLDHALVFSRGVLEEASSSEGLILILK